MQYGTKGIKEKERERRQQTKKEHEAGRKEEAGMHNLYTFGNQLYSFLGVALGVAMLT